MGVLSRGVQRKGRSKGVRNKTFGMYVINKARRQEGKKATERAVGMRVYV